MSDMYDGIVPEELQGNYYNVVILEGEVIKLCETSDEANAIADRINQGNAVSAARECGREPEDCTDDEMAEYAFMGGFEGGFAYAECIYFPSQYDCGDEEYRELMRSGYQTDNGDTFEYESLANTISSLIEAEEEQEDCDEEDDYEYDDDDYYDYDDYEDDDDY